jgi:putative aldouronate transport system substrate-binding protein
MLAGCRSSNNAEPTTTAAPASGNVASSDAAQDATEPEKEPEPAAPTPLSIFTIDSYYNAITYAVGDLPAQKIMEEATNTKLTWNVLSSAEYDEQLPLRTSVGLDLEDIIYRGPDDGLYDRGIMAELSPYITEENAPNILRTMRENPDMAASMRFRDGIYKIPIMMRGYPSLDCLWIRKDWLDKVGLEVPKTVDEYIDALAAFRDNDANGNGRKDEVFGVSGGYFNYFSNAFDMHYAQGYWSINDQGKAEYDFLMDRGLQYLTALNTMWTKGVLDPEIFAMPYDTFVAEISNNQLGGAVWYAWSKSFFEGYAKEVDPDAEYVIAVLEGPYGRQKYYKQQEFAGGIIVTSNCEDPAAAVRFCDFFFSPEGIDLTNWGIEGLSYEIVNGEKRPTEYISNNPDGLTPTEAQATIGMGINLPRVLDLEANFAQSDAASVDEMMTKVVPYLESMDSYLYAPVTSDEQNTLSKIGADFITYRDEMIAKFITGEEPLSNYSAFQEQIKALGIELEGQVIEARQARALETAK